MAKKLLITGGHSTPAIAIIEEIKSNKKNWEIYYVGSKYSSLEGKKLPSYEFQTIKRFSNIRFIHLINGKLARNFSPKYVLSMLKIPISFLHALLINIKFRPNLILSFGGSLSTPMIITAKLLGIPSITHEQTHSAGIANKINSKFVKKVAVTFPDSVSQFPPKKTVVTGNPLRKEIENPKSSKKMIKILNNKQIIYVTGGKTGSENINQVLKEILKQLLEKYLIIHQVGSMQIQEFIKLKTTFGDIQKNNYYPFEYLKAGEVGTTLKYAHLVISRSGANTTLELLKNKCKSILIPLPFSAGNEQLKNAQFLKKAGLAEIIKDHNLTPKILEKTIKKMMNSKKYSLNKNAVDLRILKGRESLFRLVEEEIENEK
jgi:UDP-N-acetylglucosamine--N-acetylmuramyl-(pentapeptide) pyrophosphoryl-undecaprenol N-acetylglucosamine transferase